MRFRDARGKLHGGAFAVNRFVLHAAPPGRRGLPARTLVVAAYVLPPLLIAEIAAYELVARNRHCRLLNP